MIIVAQRHDIPNVPTSMLSDIPTKLITQILLRYNMVYLYWPALATHCADGLKTKSFCFEAFARMTHDGAFPGFSAVRFMPTGGI